MSRRSAPLALSRPTGPVRADVAVLAPAPDVLPTMERVIAERVAARLDELIAAAKASLAEPRRDAYTRAEVADRLGVSIRQVDALIKTKQLSVLRIGATVRIPAAELARFIDAHTEVAS